MLSSHAEWLGLKAPEEIAKPIGIEWLMDHRALGEACTVNSLKLNVAA
jgi:hypothetical protein